jgi:hypothetical protein
MVNNKDPKGWSAEGIQKYKKLYNALKKDHITHKIVAKNWIAKRKARLFDATQTKTPATAGLN